MPSSFFAPTGSALRASEPFEGDEVLYEGQRSVVTRRRAAGQAASVILKRGIGAEAVRRLQHERAILQRLSSVEGVARPSPGEWDDDTLALVDDAGVVLSSAVLAGRMPFDDLLLFSLRLSRILAAVHRHGVVHKDINPSNILLAGAERRPVLVDFNIAAASGEERAVFKHETEFAGTLAYMPPEQTGRTGRPVDQRSDLYALGAVLYQLITGQLMFSTHDLLEILHHQLTTVPLPPIELAPDTPPMLSEMVMRLLEKEPDRRYQSAEGLAHDLERLVRARAEGNLAPFALCTRDFPARLAPPSRPLGRQPEIEALEAALANAVDGGGGFVLVSGAAGVGKTTLLDELRPAVAARNGWFVSGKFDNHRRESSATLQSLRSLGRLLLSEPEAELAACRERMREALGENITAGITLLPEFELLLGAQQMPRDMDPLDAEQRSFRGTIGVISSVASHQRPLVMLLDDLQWAPDATVRLIDAMLAALDTLPGFVLALSVRLEDLPPGSAMAAGVQRWERLARPHQRLRLDPLSVADVGELVATMLRSPADEAMRLSAVLHERTRGNPQDTVELINELRADGLLRCEDGGWQWDEQALRRYVSDSEGIDLLARRLDKLPASCLAPLEILACLGGEVRAELLSAACGPELGDPLIALAPAIDEGLLVAELRRSTAFRFSNNHVQECVHARVGDSEAVGRLRLVIARHLVHVPALAQEAAGQYLEVVELVHEADERRRVAGLLHRAAQDVQVVKYEVRDRYVEAATRLLLPIEQPGDAPLLLSMLEQRHLGLYAMGRHDEADALYALIGARCADPVLLARPAGVQVHSLTNRGRFDDAMALGLQVLDRLGVPKPADLSGTLSTGLRDLAAWAIDPAKAADFDRPEPTDPRLLAISPFVKRVLVAAFNQDKAVYAWLLIEAHRLWVAHGPSSNLMTTAASFPLLLVTALKDYRGAHAAAQHVIALGEARGYEPGTSMANVMSAMCATHWGSPLEEALGQSRRARKGLMQASDMQYASNTYALCVTALIATAPTLDEPEHEVAAEIAFEANAANVSYTLMAVFFRQLLRAFRGETDSSGSFSDAEFSEPSPTELGGWLAVVRSMFHVLRAMSAGVFGDIEAMRHHTKSALPLIPAIPGFYIGAYAHWFRALVTAHDARLSGGDVQARDALLAEFDLSRNWLADRAADCPTNFLHLVFLLDAERAWTVGDTAGAYAMFEQALSEAEQRSRPWHRALIHERAARFHFSQDRERTGRLLLVEATRGFDEWGAAGKVAALVAEFPFLRASTSGRKTRSNARSTIVSTEMVDMMAILRASQALSSATSLTQLNDSVVKVLGAMCGAESVLLVVRPQETPGWFLATSLAPGAEPVSVEAAAASGLLALSTFRYTERTREPLLLDDATRDHRFAADPALAGLAHCSMLLVPILKQGDLQAVLVLDNRARHSAFSADRIDSVKLIAGQLAVSIDNALLYVSLERKVAERTAALEEANQKLEQLSVTDALTGLANRRHFNQALDLEWERARRAGSSVGLAMIDIDQFKQYNDHYGHQGGDTCLQLVADAMKSDLRIGTDLIARYGGEEFVLLLRDSSLEATRIVAERVRAAVAARMEPHALATHGIVTISVGIAACVPGGDMSAAQCLEVADTALYAAKRGGRNRVEAHTPSA
jgi:diguanylate cyclase (GGDEF)-like protein